MLFALVTLCTSAQNIPQAIEYSLIYDYIDELVSDGIIQLNTAIRPYSREVIADKLAEAARKDSLLSRRQKMDLAFYMQDYALEFDTIPDYKLWGHENKAQWNKLKKGRQACDFNLALVEPSLSILTRDKNFKMKLKPILGMDLYASKKGMITKRWYGAELQMDICHHLSVWGSIRDNSWQGTGLLKEAWYPTTYDQIQGARILSGEYLMNTVGVQYKESNFGGDFSDSRGGISLYSWWGSIGLQRERITWGDAYHCSNILSGRNPAVPALTLNLRPCSWFEFNYQHAWLVSNRMDSTYYYEERFTEDGSKRHYRPANKYMAANMFTFMPVKQLSFSFGNSIVYAERNVQAAYFIPFAFYKSLDHLLTKGMASENQNSQVFASLSIRPCNHLQLYGSFYLDEFSAKRLKKENPENNPISYLVGLRFSASGISLIGEFMRSYIATYNHSIDVLDYYSNSYNMGHYMGGNAQSIFVQFGYRPAQGLQLQLSYTNDRKYNVYDYVRGDIRAIISQKPFDKVAWQNDQLEFRLNYELFNNCYFRASMLWNNARGMDVSEEGTVARGVGEDRGWAADGSSFDLTGEELTAYYTDKFAPLYYRGNNLTFMVGFSFGF